MACSQLFSGDLPELSIQIIQNLRNNFNTLYSLALVNRFWCRLAIPLLWEDPFSGNLSSHFLDIYFLFLNDSDKSKLKKINNSYEFDSNLVRPLFNYPSLIKTISFHRITLHFTNWLNPTSYNTASTSSLACLQNGPVEKMICCYQDSEKLKVIYTVLLNLFMKNNASLNNLHANNRFLLNHFCDMVVKHPKFVSEIKTFDYCHKVKEANLESVRILLSLPSLSTSIKHFSFSFKTTSLDFFANIIQTQSQLSSVQFRIQIQVPLLNSLKHSSNTLSSINFFLCQFSMKFDALSYLTQLESLQFNYCSGLNSNIIQPLLNITTPLKIKTLVIINNGLDELIEELTPIQLLIQKIGSYIENLVLSVHNYKLNIKLFDTIIDFCENVKFLYLNNIGSMVIPHLSKMIFKFSDSLKYLTLEVKYIKSIYSGNSYSKRGLKFSSMVLKVLSKSLPLSLHYLDLGLVINPDDLQIALENCKQVELKKLLIRNWSKNNLDTTLNVIKDFVKEKNLEFLAYFISRLPIKNDACYERLEKLVEETQSFIKMVNYENSIVRVSEIDGKLTNENFYL